MIGREFSDLLSAESTESPGTRAQNQRSDLSLDIAKDACRHYRGYVKQVKKAPSNPEPKREQRQRQYRGDEYGGLLVAWLNEMRHGRRNQSAYRRMVRLFRTVLQLADVPVDQTRLKKSATSIEKQLRHYSVCQHYFVMKTKEVGPQGEALDRARPFFQEGPSGGQTAREQAAFSAILELSQRGLLSNIRRCDWKKCRRWLYARFTHHRFCSEQCKDKYCDSKEFKLKHAAKQKTIDKFHRRHDPHATGSKHQ